MNCLSALRGVCAFLSVGKVCHCAPPIAQQLRCAELSQGHCADSIAQTPSSKLAWLWFTGTSIARVFEHCATHNELVHCYSHYWGHVRKERTCAWPSHTAPHACASAQLPQRLHPGWHAWTLLLARNIVPMFLPRDGKHIPFRCLPRIYNIN